MIGLYASIVVGTFTFYLPPEGGEPRIEAIIQRGLLAEMIVKCAEGTAIISYSQGDGLYCSPQFHCSRDRNAIMREACGT